LQQDDDGCRISPAPTMPAATALRCHGSEERCYLAWLEPGDA
jgi:hypothetical protein